jgi:DNA adenine methylase
MIIQTPFRYPGGKNKLLPIVTAHIDEILIGQDKFCDAFIGGGSVLLDIAKRYPQIQLYANDKDYWVYCFWKVVASTDFNKLSELLTLLEVRPTLELFYKLREEETVDEIRCAYKAIFFNRTTFSGIFKSGPIGGKEQKSAYTIDCRFNSDKLKKKIIACNKLLSGRTIIDNYDINNYYIINNTDYPTYLDPPYYIKGKALYSEYMTHNEHVSLAKTLQNRTNWILSYDDCPEIRELYQSKTFIDLNAKYCINGSKSKWEHKNELLILS